MSKLLAAARERFERWMFQTWRSSPTHAAACRLLLAGYVLCSGTALSRAFGAVPCDAMVPLPGPFMFLSCYPSDAQVFVLELVTLLSTSLLLLNVMPLWSGLASALPLVYLDAANFSLGGKIDHRFVLLVALVLVGVANTPRKRTPAAADERAWPFALLAFCIGFAVFTSGCVKLKSGWLALEDSSVQGYMIRNYFNLSRNELLAGVALRLDWPWFWELQDYLTVLVELAFLPACFSRRMFRIVIALMTVLHVGIVFTLNIAFTVNLVIYCVFLNWPAPVLTLIARVERTLHRLGIAQRVAVAATISALLFLGGDPADLLTHVLGSNVYGALTIVALAGFVFWAILGAHEDVEAVDAKQAT